MNVDLESIESSIMDGAGYNPDYKAMRIRFTDSPETLDFFDVPREVFERFMATENKKDFYFNNIKGKYESRRAD